MSVAIIGGGPGGLATALALKRANIPFRLYEAAPEIKSVGAGILLANNAMQVLRHLGIHQEVYKRGYLVDKITIAKPDFSAISYTDLKGFEKKYGLQNHAIHRADLHEILADAVGHENIELNKRLNTIKRSDDRFTLIFADGSIVEAAYVIGADGIRSQVRQDLFGENTYRDAGQVCWRGVTEFRLPSMYKQEVLEAWGKGKRFGFVPLSESRVYWFLLIDAAMEQEKTDLTVYTSDFNPLATQLINRTPKEFIIKAPIIDLKPLKIWSKPNVCLIGDAAHATTPNLGQGACQALEDAFIIGELAARHSLTETLNRYPAIRKKKAQGIVNMSWQFGKIAQLKNPVGIALRNFVLKYLTPASLNLKQMDRLFTLDHI